MKVEDLTNYQTKIGGKDNKNYSRSKIFTIFLQKKSKTPKQERASFQFDII